MNTKTCEGCGWVYPITHPGVKCRFCGTPFKQKFCPGCGLYTTFTASGLCHKCESKRVMAARSPEYNSAQYERWRQRNIKRANDKFDNWLKLIAAVPQPIKTLTQEEWIAACSYFDHCALCGSAEIDTRLFFIAFCLGGRYAAWNVIPVCEKCATVMKRPNNPFLKYDKKVMSNVVDYLQPILERTINNEQ